MLFNSFEYLIFLPIMVMGFYCLPQRMRWVYLLVGSYVFYLSWNPYYLPLIVFQSLLAYVGAIMVAKSENQAYRKWVLFVCMLLSLSVLFVFKYYNFFAENVNVLLSDSSPGPLMRTLDVLLPVGISFYTFQSISYVLDVYHNSIKPEKHLGKLALFVSYFPQLVAGPIERASSLLPQLSAPVHLNSDDIKVGLKIILLGLFKKVVVADRLALYVDPVYANPGSFSPEVCIFATILFAFQIYCDFSGYSDIAIGSARLMGVKLMQNFNLPYLATSVADFWHRWHISLSTWFRDYVYKPLGGNRCSTQRMTANILIVFVLSGLWHGANWTFLLWGLCHGILLIVGKFLNLPERVQKLLSATYMNVGITFSVVAFTWIFFRADNLHDAWYIINSSFGYFASGACFDLFSNPNMSQFYLGQSSSHFVLVLVSLFTLLFYETVLRHPQIRTLFYRAPIWIRWSSYYAAVLFVVLFGKYNYSQFIYFQF